MPECSDCGKEVDLTNLEKIDNKFVCHSCLYQHHKPFEIYPIGYVENLLERGEGFGLKGSKAQVSKIRLFNTQKPFLYKLEEEEWITVVYYLHKPRNIQSIFSRGIDRKKVGVFASRTPDRLSHIGISNVKLIKIEDTILFVRNLDAINGTPVLDIKLGQKSRW
ncbi:MAG: tRNA (N6-threonylcarbamoyladenosine(37)-N6)-methyltransferase TrmO [Candidatus Lokiarchaeota archaeon]|nr:tRNA (N6-threonylcarbamoyladenosine(37)-N6)-methyltransferase TrmO [Candidatus Lokiarchaeota archaeon]